MRRAGQEVAAPTGQAERLALDERDDAVGV